MSIVQDIIESIFAGLPWDLRFWRRKEAETQDEEEFDEYMDTMDTRVSWRSRLFVIIICLMLIKGTTVTLDIGSKGSGVPMEFPALGWPAYLMIALLLIPERFSFSIRSIIANGFKSIWRAVRGQA